MATGERITAEARGALVHLPRPPEAEPLPDPRQSDVDEWGRSEHIRELARRLYDPLYRQLFRVEWEGLEKIPTGVRSVISRRRFRSSMSRLSRGRRGRARERGSARRPPS